MESSDDDEEASSGESSAASESRSGQREKDLTTEVKYFSWFLGEGEEEEMEEIEEE